MTITCPCCAGKGKIEERAPVPLSPMQFRIYDIVRRSKYGIDTVGLVERVYSGQEDGGPLYAHRSVRTQITRANKRLLEAKLRIATGRQGPGNRYHLQHLSS